MRDQTFDLVEFASDAAFAIDDNRKIAAWNDPAQRMLGYASSEVIGMDCGDVLQGSLEGGEPLCHGDCDVFQCLIARRPYGVPGCVLQHRNGERIPASIASIAMSEVARSVYAEKVIACVFIRDGIATIHASENHKLQVFTLGGFGMTIGGRSIDISKWKRKKAVTLVKYLINQLDHPVHRERLIDCLWPEADAGQGWGRLKVTMYSLRQELRAVGLSDDIVRTIGDSYLFRRDAVWVDAAAFEMAFAEGQRLQGQMRWGEALDYYVEAQQLYRGDYMEEDIFADWCAEEQERLHELYLEMLAGTAECHASLWQLNEAIHICRKALVFDPSREHFHFTLMECLLGNGSPDLALAQYRHCEQFLAQEFDAAPMPKTQRLYQQILDENSRIQMISKQ